MARVDPRDERMFPKFSPAEIDRLRRFGHQRHYDKGQPLFVTAPGMFVLKSGRVQVTRRELTLSKPLTLVCCGRPDDAH